LTSIEGGYLAYFVVYRYNLINRQLNEVNLLCDKVQKIIDTFNKLSPENQSILLECAYNTLNAENSTKKSIDCPLLRKDKTVERITQ
jgi:hypothetical protein